MDIEQTICAWCGLLFTYDKLENLEDIGFVCDDCINKCEDEAEDSCEDDLGF